jgi:adenosyl cobinamide kinase/adenosyl cobinamide phosphate guanylyltransferase
VLILLLGGARSGKSDLAVRLAAAQPEPVVVIATAEAGDSEMAERIERHREDRPADWETIEAPIDLEAAIDAAPPGHCLILDDLTLWVANMLAEHDEAQIETLGGQAAWTAAARDGLTIVVSNETGLGIVPDNALARRYRDLLGRVNAGWAEAAEESYFMIAGRLLSLTPDDELIRRHADGRPARGA